MPTLPDQLEVIPRVEETAKLLRLSEDILYTHLRNQGIYAAHGDRIQPEVIFAALEREIEAGRPFHPEQARRL